MRFSSSPTLVAARRAILLAAFMLLGWVGLTSPLAAQNLMNDQNGRIINSTTGLIRIRSVAAELRNTNASATALQNTGTMELLGLTNQFTSARTDVSFGNSRAWRIGGLVRYARDTALGLQQIHSRFYTNLELAGATNKLLRDSVFVGGEASASALSAALYLGSGVYRVSGGLRSYQGTFYFDNARGQVLTGGEDYESIELQRGAASADTVVRANGFDPNAKIILAGTTVQTRRVFRQSGDSTGAGMGTNAATRNAAGLVVSGVLRIGARGEFPLGGGDVVVSGAISTSSASGAGAAPAALVVGADTAQFAVRNVVVSAGGISTSSSQGVMVIEAASTLRLAEQNQQQGQQQNQQRGTLTLDTNHTLIIRGSLLNAVQSRSNTRFAANSTVIYDGAVQQSVMTTSTASPYGNLTLKNSVKVLGATSGTSGTSPDANVKPVIVIAGNFAMNAATLDVTRAVLPDTSYTELQGELVMTKPAATAQFDGTSEVRGVMRRLLSPTSMPPTLQSPQNYTFNNAQTSVSFTAGQPPDEMTLDVRGGVQPANYQAPSDVRRRVVWTWNNLGSTSGGVASNRDWTATVRVGYAAGDITTPFLPQNEARLQPFVSSVDAATGSAQLLGSRSITRGAASPSSLGFVESSGIQPRISTDTSATNRFPSGAQLLLRAETPVVRSVRDGRWSNPATWSTGREPDSTDVVELAHVVHIGFRRAGVDGANADGQRRERGLATATSFASSVRVRSGAALLIGYVTKSENGADDELPPQSSWRLVSGSLRVESAPSVATTTENITRTGLLDANTGARRNTRTDYRGLLIFQPNAADTASIRIPQLVNLGAVFNGGNLEIRDE
jgi:hypothetical protein